MKKRTYYLTLTVIVLTAALIFITGCKPPEVVSSEDLGIKIEGNIVKWAFVYCFMYNSDGTYQEISIEVGDERFDEVKTMTEDVFKDFNLQKLRKRPKGEPAAFKFTYDDGRELYLPSIQHNIEWKDAWYSTNLDYEKLNEILDIARENGNLKDEINMIAQ